MDYFLHHFPRPRARQEVNRPCLPLDFLVFLSSLIALNQVMSLWMPLYFQDPLWRAVINQITGWAKMYNFNGDLSWDSFSFLNIKVVNLSLLVFWSGGFRFGFSSLYSCWFNAFTESSTLCSSYTLHEGRQRCVHIRHTFSFECMWHWSLSILLNPRGRSVRCQLSRCWIS